MNTEHKNEELEQLRAAYRADPENKDAAMRIAQCYVNQGWYNEARALYQELVARHPRDYAILLAFGNTCFAKQSAAEACAVFKKCTVLKPERIEGWNNLGIVQLSNGDYGAARASFAKVLALEPRNHGALLNMGNYYDHTGAVDKAIALFKKAAAVKPYFADAWFNLGNARLKKKEYEKAIASFEKAMKYKPADASTLKNTGYAYECMGNCEKAEAYYRRSLECNKTDPAVYVNMASVLMKLHQYDRAKGFFLDAIKLSPSNAAGWMGLRELSLKMGDIRSYVKSTLAVIHRLEAGDIAESLKTLRLLRQFEDGKEIVKAADRLEKKGTSLDAERMLIYAAQDPDKAARLYRRLTASTALSDHILQCAAVYSMNKNSYDTVLQYIGRITNKEPPDMELLWKALIKKNEIASAKNLLESYLKDNNDCFQGWFMLAKIEALQGNTEKAQKYLVLALESGFTELNLIEEDHALREIYASIAG